MRDFHCYVSGNFIHGNILETNHHDFRTTENRKTKNNFIWTTFDGKIHAPYLIWFQCYISHYLQGFIHVRWLYSRISKPSTVGASYNFQLPCVSVETRLRKLLVLFWRNLSWKAAMFGMWVDPPWKASFFWRSGRLLFGGFTTILRKSPKLGLLFLP